MVTLVYKEVEKVKSICRSSLVTVSARTLLEIAMATSREILLSFVRTSTAEQALGLLTLELDEKESHHIQKQSLDCRPHSVGRRVSR